MSKGLELTIPMIEDTLNAVIRHDPQARDEGIAVQYLAAIAGFVLAHQDFDRKQREDFIEELKRIMLQISEDVIRQRTAQAAPPPPQQEAFGIWKPDNK